MCTFFLIPLLSASTVIFPGNIISLLLPSFYFLVTGNIFLPLTISLSGGKIVTCDSVSTMNFSRTVNSFCHGNVISPIT